MTTTKQASNFFINQEQNRFENGDISDSTLRTNRSRAESIMEYVGEDTPITDIDPSDIESHFSDEYSQRTARRYAQVANRMKNMSRNYQFKAIQQAREDLEQAMESLNTLEETFGSSSGDNS
jgi:hypothetical protein